LLKDIGYSADNKVASSVITNILESFQREGLINYEEFYEEIITNKGISVPSPRKRLKFVASVKADMRPVE
jgi:site-specific DNA-cytosine methylase